MVVSLLVLSASFHLINRHAKSMEAVTSGEAGDNSTTLGCSEAKSCYDCVEEMLGCGFCVESSGQTGECVSMYKLVGNVRLTEEKRLDHAAKLVLTSASLFAVGCSNAPIIRSQPPPPCAPSGG